jgi:hypothetical protein
MAFDVDELRKKYEGKLDKSFGREEKASGRKGYGDAPEAGKQFISSEYYQFKKESIKGALSAYEKLCNFSEKIMKVEPDKEKLPEIIEAIRITHLQVNPAGVTSLSIVGPILFALVVIGTTYILPALLFPGSESLFFVFLALLAGLGLIIPLQRVPFFLANNWRMKASNQMVLCIFYVVTYMRHTSNLERALGFASDHLAAPLSLDLKKVLWDVESEKHTSLKESLDEYLQTWRKYNMEFVEAMHLVESSLYESSESRRLDALDKSLNVILDETYEKMLHYAHNLKGPLSALHMLGIILPILGLVILPLMVSFMPEVKWVHLAVLYNIILPVLVYYLAKNILSTRPTGYGDTDISETNPELRKYRYVLLHFGKAEIRISPFIIALLVGGLFLFIGLLPLLLHFAEPGLDIALVPEGLKVIDSSTDPEATHYFLGYRRQIVNGVETEELAGPYGIGALVLSIFLVLGAGLGFGLYYKLKTRSVIRIREQSKALEQEFAAALFQLGNRLGDGLPAEVAFGRLLKSCQAL